MNELADIYEADGDVALSEKYRGKAELIANGGYKEE
jgi:hypothetical protein